MTDLGKRIHNQDGKRKIQSGHQHRFKVHVFYEVDEKVDVENIIVVV